MNFYKYNNNTGLIVASGISQPDSVDQEDYDSDGAYQIALQNAVIELMERLGDSDHTAVPGIAYPQSQKVDINTGALIDYTPPVITIDYGAINRNTRNLLLQQSDWTHVIDNPLSDSDRVAWTTFRQELRDLPTTVSTFYTDYLKDSDLPNPP